MKNTQIVLFAALSALVFILFFHQINAINQDLGRHLLLGRIIIQTQRVPKTNLLSYTNPDFPFINTHWFSEVVFYLLEHTGGFFFLLLVTSLVATVAFLIQLLFVKNNKTVPIVLATCVYLQILSDRTDLRPEIFSFLYLSIFIIILYQFRSHFTKWIYLLPLVELLWVNSHIYFPIGIFVIALFLIDRILTKSKKIFTKETIVLFVILITTGLLALLNPNTIRGATYPLFVFQNYGFPIEENYNVFDIWNLYQHKTAILYFFISVPLLFLFLFLSIKKSKPIDWLLAISFTIIAATAERNLPLFVFTTFIAFTNSLNNIYVLISPLKEKNFYVKNFFFLLVLLFVVWQTITIATYNPFGYALTPDNASRGVDFLLQNKIKGPIFNNFDIGSYLLYRLYPQEKVYVDGRPEAYPASFFKNNYIAAEQNKSLFQKADNTYHFNVIFIWYTDLTPWNQQFLRDINANPHWKLVYLDPSVVIYVKNIPENQYISDNDVLRSVTIEKTQLTKTELNNLLVFYENIGWTNEIKSVDKQLLQLDPNSCLTISNLGTLLENENDPEYMVYAQRFQSICK
jgi:hypothetical protein